MDYPLLPHEAERLRALDELNILDSEPDEHLDAITKSAQDYFNCKICLISLVAEDRQWFKSRQCLDAAETPRNVSFCTYAIAEEEYLIVPDATKDYRFAGSPLVKGEPFIRAYAGMILKSEQGYELGTLCVIHDEPREFSSQDVEVLRELGKKIELVLNNQRR